MAIDGEHSSYTYGTETVLGNGHPPVVRSGDVKASNGIYPMGLLVSLDGSDDMVEFAQYADEVLGTGDGSTAAFTGTLTNTPVHPGTVVVTDGTETFSDDGMGNLTGDAGGSGTINYQTGAISVTFNANVTNAVDVEVDYDLKLHGVICEKVDTSSNGSANYVVHGSVRADLLKVGITAEAAPADAVLQRLEDMGIWPE